MAQLPVYDPADFSAKSFNSDVLPDLDTEHAAIKAVLDAARGNLAAIQRDDTALANGVVHRDALATETLALFAAAWNPRPGGWQTLTDYAKLDVVAHDGDTWICTTDHTSGTFATDQGNGLWLAITQTETVDELIPVSSAGTASAYTVTTGNGYSSWANVPPLIVDWHTNNNDNATVAVDGLTAKNLTIEGANVNAGELSGQDIIAYDSGTDAMVVVGRDRSSTVVKPQYDTALTGNRTIVDNDLVGVSHLIQPIDISGGSGITITLKLPAPSSANKGKFITMQLSADDGNDDSTNKAEVTDSGDTEVYTGVRKGDFVTLYSDGASAWHVLDHYESHATRVYVNADQSIALASHEQVTNLAESYDYGDIFDAATDKDCTVPFDCWIDLAWLVLSNQEFMQAEAKLNGAYIRDTSEPSTDFKAPALATRILASKNDVLDLWVYNSSAGSAYNVLGDGSGNQSFATVKLTRIY